MIIDAHNHPDYMGLSCRDIISNMDKYQIDRTWLLTLETPEDEYLPSFYHRYARPDGKGAIPFSSCLACKETAPERFVLGYAPDPRIPYAIERLAAAIEMYGVKVCGEIMLRMMYDSPDAISMFRFCGEKGLPVILEVNYGAERFEQHTRPNYWYGGGIEAFERMLKACPETVFLGHGPGFWAHLSSDDLFDKYSYPQGKLEHGGRVEELMRLYPNLHCDLSAGSGLNALKRDPAFAKTFLLEFQNRVVYGRDLYGNQHQEFLNTLGLPGDVLDKIYSGNALRLVKD
ncbi:amidohydrolase family protein [Paenibacillus eucommiae]|uniref:TIM-barrel fold metal-dependent hydrolase n=1 Tax=Paenibacillus eucommiae TaxID=1355755 RepID=A0ABS4J0P3_9BACL|nr:amidohydrolase family protein [Paenibacillus eucommiae]MBP1993414.1 putative TIM-barrel fold metal-dependent hydrolase [Paenibacillus eucommiae]